MKKQSSKVQGKQKQDTIVIKIKIDLISMN